MHRDAPRCTVTHRDELFLLWYLLNCTECHQTDFYCFIEFFLHRDAPRWLHFFYNNFCIAPSATKMIFITYLVPICTVMHRDAPWCTEMHRDAPRWLYIFYNIFWIAPSATKVILFALFSSYLHRDTPRCTMMHRDAPWYTEMALFLL